MEKNKKLVKGLHILASVAFIFTLILAAVILVVLVGSQFIQIPNLDPSLFSSRFIFDNAFTLDVSFIDGGNLRPVINRILITGIITVGYLSGFLFLMKLILKNVRDDKVFISQNSTYIKYMGYSLIGFSVVISLCKFWVAGAIMNVIDIPSAHFGANFSFDFQTIFIGLVIVLLSQIFAYGTHLQNEYDATV